MLGFDKPITIHVNASDVAIGVVLTKKLDDKDMPIYCYSKWLNETEAWWSIYECELYTIVLALGKWRCYLVNRHTVVYSDHLPLLYFISLLKLLAKLQRWLDFIADFFTDILYQPGKHNILPDVLSRQPAPPTDVLPCGDASLSSTILEPSWLTKVYLGQLLDVTLDPFIEKSKSSDSEFVVTKYKAYPYCTIVLKHKYTS